MVKAYFCRPISFARKPNDWVKSKNRAKIFCQRLTRSSCTCVKLTCRRQRFNRLEYVLAIFYIKNTILTPHTILKCFFFGILIYDLDFCNKLNKTCGFLPYHRACVVLSERLLIRAAEKSDSSIACFWLARTVPCWVEVMSRVGYRCPELGTLGSFGKKDIKHIVFILFRYLLVWTYL